MKGGYVMDKKLSILNYIIIIFSIIVFGEYLINFATYSSSYILFLLFFILLAMHVFVVGLLINKESVYKRNIKLYLILYIILLISLTIFINRPDFALFDAKYLQMYVANINLIPFKTISHFLFDNVNLGVRLYNIIGNLVALMPLSFLLILFDKKYESYKKQIIVLFITVLIIEFMQFILAAGRLDIDDFILNIGGALLFFTLIKKTGLINVAKTLFNNDLSIPKVTKYIVFGLVSLAIIVMDVLFIVDLSIKEEFEEEHDYFEAHVIRDNCLGLRKVEMADYNLYIDCIDVSFNNDEGYSFTLDEALNKEQIDLNNLDRYFNVIEYLDDVIMYRDDDFSLFVCKESKDIYAGDENLKYNGECIS